MPNLQDIENVLAKNFENWLLTKEASGFESHQVSVFRVVKNDYTSVYGVQSGEEGSKKVADIKCVLVGDDFFPADAHSAGGFQEGWMYTTSDQVLVGDRVDVIRSSGQGTRRYKVTDMHKLGTTRFVFRKYKLSALGD